MKTKSKKRTTALISKLALLLSVLIFSGYNTTVHTFSETAVRTELLLTERISDASQTFSLEDTEQSSKVPSGFNKTSSFRELIENHNCLTNLNVKIQTNSYLSFKSTIANIQISNQNHPSFPDEGHNV